MKNDRTDDRVRAAVDATTLALDDVTRTRIGTRIQAALDELPPAERSTDRAGRRRVPVGWRVAGIAAALMLAIGAVRWHESAMSPTQAAAIPAPTTPGEQHPRPPVAKAPKSTLGGGFSIIADGQVISTGLARIEVPAGASVTTSLEDVAQFEIHGPAKVTAKRIANDEMTVALANGRLWATYRGGPQRMLTIEAPGFGLHAKEALFAVNATPGAQRVSVARGQVVIRADRTQTAIIVAEGQTWVASTGRAAIKPRLARRLSAFATRLSGSAPSEPSAADVAIDEASRWYSQAEAALSAGDTAVARRHLERIIDRHPAHPLAQTARYELALWAYREGDHAGARTHLSKLIARGHPTLDEPAHYLMCRTRLGAGEVDAAVTCLKSFRRAYPRSPHAAEALALIIGFIHREQGCAAALPLIDTYLRTYPRGPFAAAAQSRRRDCGR